jgi:hypothetical protein
MFNLYTCNKCGLFVIEEELDSHKCLEIKTQTIEGQDFVYDGKRLVPLTPAMKQWLSNTQRRNRTVENGIINQ